MYDMLKQYSDSFHSDFQAMTDANGDELSTRQYRSKVTENFKNDLKIHQYEMIKCKKIRSMYSLKALFYANHVCQQCKELYQHVFSSNSKISFSAIYP